MNVRKYAGVLAVAIGMLVGIALLSQLPARGDSLEGYTHSATCQVYDVWVTNGPALLVTNNYNRLMLRMINTSGGATCAVDFVATVSIGTNYTTILPAGSLTFDQTSTVPLENIFATENGGANSSNRIHVIEWLKSPYQN